MKKYIPYFLLVVSLVGAFILIFNNNKVSSTKVITVDTLHSYLYSNDQMIQIPLYVSGNKHTIDNINSYDHTYLTNDEGSKIFIDLEEITYSHEEKYLNETYLKYILKFKMPNLTEEFKMTSASLNINWINNELSSFKIGNIYFSYLENTSNVLWTKIDSKSDIDSNLPQMNTIEVELEQNISNIEAVNIASDYSLEYVLDNDKLVITVPNINLNISYIPLWIKYNNQIMTINNNHFIIEFNLLEKAGKLVNIYVFD